jgi:hypothetical protein
MRCLECGHLSLDDSEFADGCPSCGGNQTRDLDI